MIHYQMPWQADGPLDLTLLRAPGYRLTKLIQPDGIVGYAQASLFEVDALRIECIEDVAALLLDLAPRADTAIIRAMLKAPTEPFTQLRRTLYDHGAVEARFREVGRSWVMVDVEPKTCPVDPTDPEMVGGWLRRQLPTAFQGARCVVQLSSGAGVKPGARAHLWFLLDRPVTNADLDQLLGEVDGVDAATFRAVQIHYTASPIFTGVDDPCTQGRIAVLPGLAEVKVPDLEPEPARPGFIPGSTAPGYVAPERGLWFKATRSERYMISQLGELAAAPAGARHPAIVRVAVRLFGLAHAGALDPVVVTGRIKKIAQPWGDLGEVDRILSWAWDHATPWRMS